MRRRFSSCGAATRVERAVERCPSHHRTTLVQTTKARLPAGEQTAVSGPRLPTDKLCLAPLLLMSPKPPTIDPTYTIVVGVEGRPAWGAMPPLNARYSISSSTSTCHDGRPARLLCGRRRRPLFSSPTPGYVLRAPDRRLPSGASPISLCLAFDFSHTPFYRNISNKPQKTT